MNFLFEARWSPYLAGAGIGVLSWLSFLVLKKPLSCSTAFARAGGMIEKAIRGRDVERKLFYQETRPVVDWQFMLVLGIVAGAFLSAVLSGDFSLSFVPPLWGAAFGGNPALRFVAALFGGTCIGFGARWADGCTSGHGISGTMQLALSGWVSAVCFFAGGIVTAHALFRGLG